MPNYTTHYNLTEQLGNEHPSTALLSSNFATIDEQMYKNSVLTGTTAPTTSTVGAVGQLYLDTVAKVLYQCMTQGPVYTWKQVPKEWKLLQAYTTAGSYTFTTPENITELGALIIGGGASGQANGYQYNANTNLAAVGGGSGYFDVIFETVTAGSTKNVVVGAGGASVTGSVGGAAVAGKAGGSSAFDGFSVSGGSGSSGTGLPITGASGGQCSMMIYQTNADSEHPDTPYGGVSVPFSESTAGYAIIFGAQPASLNSAKLAAIETIFKDNVFNLAAGGSCYALLNGTASAYTTTYAQSAVTFKNGRHSSGAAIKFNGVTGIKGTDYGCGGGAVIGIGTSAAGCDGAVLIYGR